MITETLTVLATPYQEQAQSYIRKDRELSRLREQLEEAKDIDDRWPHICDCNRCEENTENRVEYASRQVRKAESELKAIAAELRTAIKASS